MFIIVSKDILINNFYMHFYDSFTYKICLYVNDLYFIYLNFKCIICNKLQFVQVKVYMNMQVKKSYIL